MIASAEHLERMPRVVFVGRFTEDLPAALGHRIARQDQPSGNPWHDVGSLLSGKTGDKLFGRFPAANPALGRFVGDNDLEFIARFGQQIAPTRGTTGEDKFGAFLAVHRRKWDEGWETVLTYGVVPYNSWSVPKVYALTIGLQYPSSFILPP